MIKVRINVESIPPLNAIQIFFTDEMSNCFLRVFVIDFSISSTEGFSINGLESFQVFLGRFGVIDVSYLNVRMSVIEECSGDKKLDSTSKSSKN